MSLPWLNDASWKVVGLNPGDCKGFFSLKITFEVNSPDHLTVELVHCECQSHNAVIVSLYTPHKRVDIIKNALAKIENWQNCIPIF